MIGDTKTGNRQTTAVLVAGMHRSGTSVLSRVLGLAKGDLLKTLMRQNDMEGRRNGYSESWVTTRLNKEIISVRPASELQRTRLVRRDRSGNIVWMYREPGANRRMSMSEHRIRQTRRVARRRPESVSASVAGRSV